MAEPKTTSRELHAPLAASERTAGAIFLGAGLVSIATSAGIIAVLLGEALGFFREVSLGQFFGDREWTPLYADQHFGIWPLVSGTALTTLVAALVAMPAGLLAAIYLGEFAGERARRWLKPTLEILGGVPSLVYGYFALVFVSPVLQRLVPKLGSFSALSAGLVLGIMILPVVASHSQDAIARVPWSLREAAYALGATRLGAVFRVVVPCALSGILGAVILGISRAVGETMIVAIASGQQPRLTLDPRVAVETLTTYIVQISLGDAPTGTLEYRTLFVVGLSLFLLTLGLNLASHRLRRRTRELA
jgi:phosphate transport system permease protein